MPLGGGEGTTRKKKLLLSQNKKHKHRLLKKILRKYEAKKEEAPKFKTPGATMKLKLSLVVTGKFYQKAAKLDNNSIQSCVNWMEKRHSSSYEIFAEGCEPVKGTISVSLKEIFSFLNCGKLIT
ncbi:hypothetical protein CN671_30575 [Bacillus toyonensis]|nr:hypothetical protein CN671_30575 [Bacillus toyonensis]PFZ65646.1 hypothetical protein COL72_30570 [Bacillus toyonensis]